MPRPCPLSHGSTRPDPHGTNHGQYPARSFRGIFLLARSALFSPRSSVTHRGPATRSRTDSIDAHAHSVFSPWLGPTHLGLPINTASRVSFILTNHSHPQPRSEQRSSLFTAFLCSPSMTRVTKALPSLFVPASLRPRTEVSRNKPVRPSCSPSVPSHR